MKTKIYPFIYVIGKSSKEPREMTIITSTVNKEVYIQILDNILISTIENTFEDKEVISQDDNVSFYRAKRVKSFLLKRHINSMK